MSKMTPAQYVREVRQEVSKITWPTKKETIVTTGMVFIMVFLAAMFFLGADTFLSWAVHFILGLGR